jgi:excisionase family DNA binding protein
MIESREVMNVRQASQYLGISPDTLYKYVAEERIPAFKLGNRWKFKKTMLDRWMERQSAVKEERPAPASVGRALARGAMSASGARRSEIQAARARRGGDGQR